MCFRSPQMLRGGRGGTASISFWVHCSNLLPMKPSTNLLLLYSRWLYAPSCCHGGEGTTYTALPPCLGIDAGGCAVQAGGDTGGRRGETRVDLPLLSASGVVLGSRYPPSAIWLLDCSHRGSSGKRYALLNRCRVEFLICHGNHWIDKIWTIMQ